MPEKDVVWSTKYRYKVLEGAMRDRIRVIIRQTCGEMGVHIVKGVMARGYFSTTSGNITDDVILPYLELHSKRDAAGVSR